MSLEVSTFLILLVIALIVQSEAHSPLETVVAGSNLRIIRVTHNAYDVFSRLYIPTYVVIGWGYSSTHGVFCRILTRLRQSGDRFGSGYLHNVGVKVST